MLLRLSRSKAQYPEGLERASFDNHVIGNAFRSEGRASIPVLLGASSKRAPRRDRTPSAYENRENLLIFLPRYRRFSSPFGAVRGPATTAIDPLGGGREPRICTITIVDLCG
jgi:hypothetical protein